MQPKKEENVSLCHKQGALKTHYGCHVATLSWSLFWAISFVARSRQNKFIQIHVTCAWETIPASPSLNSFLFCFVRSFSTTRTIHLRMKLKHSNGKALTSTKLLVVSVFSSYPGSESSSASLFQPLKRVHSTTTTSVSSQQHNESISRQIKLILALN